ncbi:hypothetical protein ABVT39_003034 [Epinephelus coioides]
MGPIRSSIGIGFRLPTQFIDRKFPIHLRKFRIHEPPLPGFTVPQLGGQTGRPVFQITHEQLQMLLSFNFSGKQIAVILGVSKSTVKRRLRQYNLSFRGRYTDLTDDGLDQHVWEIVSSNDDIGPEAVRARLVGEGIIVPRHRVWQSVIRTNPEGAALRSMSHRLCRRTYRVAGPNSLWHIDGNHKLIKKVAIEAVSL